LDGDMTALRLCLDRIIAPRSERVVSFAMPPIAGAADLAAAMAALSLAAADGVITPGEAAQFSWRRSSRPTSGRSRRRISRRPRLRRRAPARFGLRARPDHPRMQMLIARYRDECDIERLIFQLKIADAHARSSCPCPATNARIPPDPLQKEQVAACRELN